MTEHQTTRQILSRIVTAEQRAEISTIGPSWDADEITVADVIAGVCGIGYGGHFDEMSDDEAAAYDCITEEPEVLILIHAARYDYTHRLYLAMEGVAVLNEG